LLIKFRLGEQTTKDTLLLSERKEKDELKKVLSETEYRNEELVIKIEEENKKVEHLQDTITM
jgi:myosin-5